MTQDEEGRAPATIALLPCPFCGGEACIRNKSSGLIGEVWPYVQCLDCEASGATADMIGAEAEAVLLWNIRADAAHREAHTAEMLGVLHQYVSDLRYPPTGDSIQRRIERAEAVIAKVASITDCGPDGGCEECDVCRYLNFLEWAGAVGKPEGSTIERNDTIDAYLRVTYPDQFAAGK